MTTGSSATGFQDLQAALPDRYRLIREIGRGGMATVYLADDIPNARHVAIKVMSGELGATLDGERFQREIRIAAEIAHPNILPAYESGSGGGFHFYVMPFIEGESVRARLDKEGQLGIDEALRITAEVCDALSFAHARGVVHRDIKPENILLQDGRAVVADFGIARLTAEAGGQTLTKTGLSIGTAQYMSPEQAAAEKVDGRSDEYAVACVLCEMLIGEPPFTGPNAMAVMARAVSQPAPSLRVVRATVPEYVEWAVLRALEKVPADRFAGVAEFKAALLGGDGPGSPYRSARGYTSVYGARRPGPPWWRGRAVLGAGALVLAAAVDRSRRVEDLTALRGQGLSRGRLAWATRWTYPILVGIAALVGLVTALITWFATGWALPLAGVDPPDLPRPAWPGALTVLGTTVVVFLVLAVVAAATGRDLHRRVDRREGPA